ncbi:hypothetical protein QOZ80_8BG0666070 [Eleusine coracana subsp. coracana]|nr:hypothetical protein QOZ80_8BG0666070 [Eleusine coracana subsp. coracana]
MNSYLRNALRAARLRWVPRTRFNGEHREPHRAPHPCRRYKPLEEEEEDEEGEEKLALLEKRRMFRAARRIFMDYLHVTRGLSFDDAEHISKHSPIFVNKLLDMVKDAVKEPVDGSEPMFKSKGKKTEMRDERVSKALVRQFNYYPINEFEPFMESIGLKPSEYEPFLPQDLIFLADNETLLSNYHVLCNYGVMRTKIGRIYREAAEVFSFDENVLQSKLQDLEDLGFSKTSVIKLVISSPVILVRDLNTEFKVLQWLDDVSIERDWIVQFLYLTKSYNWIKMVDVPQFFSEMGFEKEAIGILIRKNPDFLLDGSGKALFNAVSIMIKAGSKKQDLFDLFLNFPNIRVRYFAKNIIRGEQFLAQIGASEEDIKKFVVSNALVLGSTTVKKANSILTNLCVGRKRLCKLIMDEPHRLMEYTLGSKVDRLLKIDRAHESLSAKTKFLKSIGFVEGSDDMKKALKSFRGKGDELQDRYEFLVKSGFDPKDVVDMIKSAPQILNQKTNIVKSKISVIVNESGYPLSALVSFPACLSFTIERTKSRFLMYNWLVERGVLEPNFALSSIHACAEKKFMKSFVQKHEMGHEVWEKIRREVASTKNTHCTSVG